ncbi:MAG: M48 family metalloprotease [Elusimicrobia bacterium]|nr:M48 family metalloprotease [Elusimicrobiota bacterium]
MRQPYSSSLHSILLKTALFCAFAAILTGCVRNPVTGSREIHLLSEKAEIQLGVESKLKIIQEYGLYVQPAIQSYVNEVGRKIVRSCERQNIAYDFVILDTPLVNAFAVPGTVFLTRGILELIDDEAELAGVIGHEIGHITGFHAVKMLQKAFGYQFLSTLSTVAIALYGPSVDDPRAYAVIHQATQLVAASFLSGYGREFELEADRSGLRYAVLAGYDPDAFTSFFKRMKSLGEQNSTGIGIFLRTHPPTDERIRQVRRILEMDDLETRKKFKRKVQADQYKKVLEIVRSTDTHLEDQFDRYQTIIKTMPRSPQEYPGTIQDSTYGNLPLKLKLSVPKGWKLEIGFGRTLVLFRSLDGRAQGDLQFMPLEPDPLFMAAEGPLFAGTLTSTSPITSRSWAESLEPKLKLEKRTGREVAYPAGQAYLGTYRGPDRLGRPTIFRRLTIVTGTDPYRQKGFLLTCAAPEEAYVDYLVDMEKIMQNLKFEAE